MRMELKPTGSAHWPIFRPLTFSSSGHVADLAIDLLGGVFSV
jgi:hypothetical protein